MYNTEENILPDDRAAFNKYCEEWDDADRDRAAHNFLINRLGVFENETAAALFYCGDCLGAGDEADETRLECLFLDCFLYEHPEGVLAVQNVRPYYSNGHNNVPSLTGAW